MEKGRGRWDVGDFFCPRSLDKMSDMENGEDWVWVGLMPLSQLPLLMPALANSLHSWEIAHNTVLTSSAENSCPW